MIKMTKMRSVFNRIFQWSYKSMLWLTAIFILFIAVIVLLHWQTNVVAEMVTKYINHSLSGKGEIRYSNISGSLVNSINIKDLSFDLNDKLTLTSNKITLKYDILSLWNKQIKISSVDIDSIQLNLIPHSKSSAKQTPFNLDSLLAKIQHAHFLDTLLTKMPRLELDDLAIKTGYLSIPGKKITVENINLKANAFFKPENFKFELVNCSAYWKEKDFKLDNLQFQALGNRKQVTINKFGIQSGKSHFFLAGDIEIQDLNMFLAIDDFNLDFNTLSGFIPNRETNGNIEGRLSFIGKPQDFAVTAKINGFWQQYIFSRLNVSAAYELGNIVVDTLQIHSNAGDLFLKGNINPQKSAQGQLKISNFNLNDINASFAPSSINNYLKFTFPSGTFDINHLAKTFKNITGDGQLLVYHSFYGNYKLDSLRFAITTNKGNLKIDEPSFIKIANQARFDIYGELSRKKILSLQIHTAEGDLNSLTSALGLDSLYGTYYSDFKAFGNLTDPTIQGYFWMDSLRYKKVLLDSIGFDFQVSTILSRPFGTANFNIKKGLVYNIPVRNASLNASIDSMSVNVSNARIFSNDNYIETTLNIFPEKDTTRIAIDYLRMEYENYWLKNDEQIKLAIDSVKVKLNDFNLTGPGNTFLKLNGIYNIAQNDANISLDLQSLNIEPFQQFLGEEHKASGVLSGKAELKNILSSPEITVDIGGQNIFYRDVSMGNFNADLQYDKEKIFVRKFDLQSDSTKLSVAGDLAFEFHKKVTEIFDLIKSTQTNLKIQFSNVNLHKYSPLLPLKSALFGDLNGSLELEGTVNQPFMHQSFSLNNFRYKKYRVDSLVMFGQYSGGYLILDSLSANFNGTSFSMKGYQQLDLGLEGTDSTFMDNPFEFYLASKGKRLDFIGLFNSQVESIHGPYQMELNISGTPEKPSISNGFIKLQDGTLLLSRVKDPVKDVNIDMTIDNNILTINDFEAVSKQEQDIWQKGFALIRKIWSWMLPKEKETGTLAVNGTINLENLLKPGVNLQIAMNEFYADYFVENTKVTLSTDNLKLAGNKPYQLSGTLTIPYGEYEVNLDQIQKNMYLSQSEKVDNAPVLTMELDIEIPGNFVVTSSALDLQNNFRISLAGNLQATLNKDSQNMSLIGVLETESGKFTSFNQSFNVLSGEIDFNDPLKINPELNIKTEKIQHDKRFDLIISGNLESIQQQIVVYDNNTGRELPLSPQDKIALLTLGADISTVASSADSTIRGVGEDVATNVVITAAERGVEELTGFDKVEISSSDKLLDLQKLKLNNGLKQASIAFGKYLTSDLYVEYRTQFGNGVPTPKLSWDAGNKISLQYRIDKNWSLDSNYEKVLPTGDNKIQLGISWEYTF